MAYSTINKPTDYFNTVLYTGDGNTTQAITGVGFQPDWLWIKHRNGVSDHQLSDIVRGKSGSLYYQIQTNGTSAQSVQPDNDGVHSLDSDGFTVGYTNSTAWNQNSSTYAAWNWLAGGTPSSNTDGSITSSVSANTTSGFSVLTYTNNGTAGATVGHGLGVAPSVVITKSLNLSAAWGFGHDRLSSWSYDVRLNGTNAESTGDNLWNGTAPSSSVVTLGNNSRVNYSVSPGSYNYVMYCFAEKKGYSKFGSYIGNGSTDGTFVYTGFKPAWVIIKRTDSTGSWIIRDNKRKTFNVNDSYLLPSSSDVEVTSAPNNKIDLLSNGFKQRSPSAGTVENASGGTYIYMAFAERSLVGTNNIPALAR